MSTATPGFRLQHRLQVRQSEVDGKQVVFNAHHLSYLDVALEAYWRALGLATSEPLAPWQGSVFVRRATLDYLAPARLREHLSVGLRCAAIGRSSMRFEGAIQRHTQTLVQAELVQSFVPFGAGRSAPVPEALRELVQAFEAGERMLSLTVGPWSACSAQAHAVRHAVFVDEQGIAAALDQDGADETAVHAVVCNRLGSPVATGRLLREGPGEGRIGRLAVMPQLRQQGLGRQVLRALVQQARARGDHRVSLHAQLGAIAFYRAEGFEDEGPAFEEAGLMHQTLSLRL